VVFVVTVLATDVAVPVPARDAFVVTVPLTGCVAWKNVRDRQAGVVDRQTSRAVAASRPGAVRVP
jgi:hypothetical protein